jgi:putative ABC transport system permease protein
VSTELAQDEGLRVGDPVKVTVYPDAEGRSRIMGFEVDGIYRSFPPSNPFAEAVTTRTALADADLAPPDFFLAKTSGDANLAARSAAHALPTGTTVIRVGRLLSKDRRSLTTLNLGGLGRIAATGAALIAALGVAVLGAFVILERRREAAVLQAVGADTRQLLQHIVVEAGAVVGGSVTIGTVVGLGLGVLTVRVLGLFFALPTPLLVVPLGSLSLLAGGTIVGSVVALAVAVKVLMRISPAETLREL